MIENLLRGLISAKISGSSWILIGVLAVMLVGMFAMSIVTRRRQMKNQQQLLDALSVGDEIMTTTGMIGKVTKINRKSDMITIFLETGTKTEKSTMEFCIEAVARILKDNKGEESVGKIRQEIEAERKAMADAKKAEQDKKALEKKRNKEDIGK